jgi:branched-chain amino acid transport system ATP-binding protein
MNSDELILETRNLHRHFGGVRAVDVVAFRLRRGELRCLIGPNGAGKSTFFKLLSGQIRPTAGTILFEGTTIGGVVTHEISRLGIGIKNQVPSVYEGLPVFENLWIAARSRNRARHAGAVAERLLDRLNLHALADHAAATLAHGQRQWLEIAMVVARQPKLVLLDEPAAGMAQDEVGRTAALIREINRDASVIVVEHDMQFIRQLDTLVTVFHQGQILVEDTMDNIQRNARVREIYLGSATHA